jgi:hypothetical protein
VRAGTGWAAHGARPWLALLALPLLAAALTEPGGTAGEVARIALIGGSCVTVGRLVAGSAPLPLVKAGVVAMATVDAIIIFGHLFDQQNAQFVGAVPASGLPQLQVARLGHASTDYGDFFAAGLAGAVIAVDRKPQLAAAVAMFGVSQAFNQLFLVVDSLPATVPPALVLVAFELVSPRGARATRRLPRIPLSRGGRSARGRSDRPRRDRRSRARGRRSAAPPP